MTNVLDDMPIRVYRDDKWVSAFPNELSYITGLELVQMSPPCSVALEAALNDANHWSSDYWRDLWYRTDTGVTDAP